MSEHSRIEYDEQIDKFVLGFVQLWDKFENTLSGELAPMKKRTDGEHGNANYELFYRVGSSISPLVNPTMGELSTSISVPLSTATRIVDYLVERGFLERLPDPEDRRVVRVTLTPSGKELHQTIDNHVKLRVRQIFSSLSVRERESLFSAMAKILTAMRGEAQ
jgi:DNA-binding MarR family transcriptional regulator